MDLQVGSHPEFVLSLLPHLLLTTQELTKDRSDRHFQSDVQTQHVDHICPESWCCVKPHHDELGTVFEIFEAAVGQNHANIVR